MRNQATEFAVTLNNIEEDITSESLAEDVAFVFLSPYQIFKLWIRSLFYKLK